MIKNYCKKYIKGGIIMSKWEEELEQDVNKFNKHKKKIYIAFSIFSIICLLALLFAGFMFFIFPVLFMYILGYGQH